MTFLSINHFHFQFPMTLYVQLMTHHHHVQNPYFNFFACFCYFSFLIRRLTLCANTMKLHGKTRVFTTYPNLFSKLPKVFRLRSSERLKSNASGRRTVTAASTILNLEKRQRNDLSEYGFVFYPRHSERRKKSIRSDALLANY